MRHLVLILATLLLPVAGMAAEPAPTPRNLQVYRLQAALPSLCGKLGGTLAYGTHAQRCDLPKVVSGKTPTSAGVAGRPLPITARH